MQPLRVSGAWHAEARRRRPRPHGRWEPVGADPLWSEKVAQNCTSGSSGAAQGTQEHTCTACELACKGEQHSGRGSWFLVLREITVIFSLFTVFFVGLAIREGCGELQVPAWTNSLPK